MTISAGVVDTVGIVLLIPCDDSQKMGHGGRNSEGPVSVIFM